MAKIEIDNKKMWESLRKAMWYFPEAEWLTRSIDTALSEQGLTVNDKGEITTIEPKPKYYKCIKEYKGFTLGKIYKTNDNGDLPSDPEFPFVIWIENPYFEEFFRPATDEEISQENIPTFKEVERNGKIEQKPVEWSSRDDSYFEELTEASGLNELQIEWLTEIKDRVQPQPRQEWSEEDETVLNNLIYALANDRIGNNRDEYVDWLKSLRPQKQWKPSEEQMLAVRTAVNVVGKGTLNGEYLTKLYNDLKAL